MFRWRATAQLSKAQTLTAINALGYNTSINQMIVGGLTRACIAVAPGEARTQGVAEEHSTGF